MSSPSDVQTHILGGSDLRIPSVTLVVLAGPDRGQAIRLSEGTTRIGTAPKNELRLSDPAVSRLHAEMTVRRTSIVVRDAGSTNGTFIDGVRVETAHLVPGGSVTVGTTTLRADVDGEPILVELSDRTALGGMVGGSVEMRRIYAIVERVAKSDATVLIQGETGTGKELVARAIHELSPRAAGPFVAIDCGAIPENLMESELFGHVRGAFSGATSERAGAFDEAEGGTLFFDEVGELPSSLQKKLLRALETRQIRKVGGSRERHANLRVLAATNRELSSSVNDGLFREDLFYRLAVVTIEIPPLRMRRDDIALLAQHFIERFTGKPERVPPAILKTLITRGWPGNVRELRNYVERQVVLDLGGGDARAAIEGSTSELPPGIELLVPIELAYKDARDAWMARFDEVYVRALLGKTGGNVTRAAELAGLNRRFLQRLMARLRMRDDSEDAGD